MAIDPTKVDQQLAEMVASMAPFLDGAEPNNVLARLQSQVVPAFVRWRANETNRRTEENVVLNAIVCFVSSQLVSAVCEVIGDTDIEDVHFELANKLLHAIGDEVGSIMTGDRKMQAHHVAVESAH